MKFVEVTEHIYSTAAEWTATSRVLLIRQVGVESDTGKKKHGNGLDLWPALPYDPTPGTAGGTTVSVTITVTEDIAAFEFVNVDGSKADHTVVGKRNKVLGMALNDIASGFSGEVVIEGEVTNPAWDYPPGSVLWLDGAGASSAAPSIGFIQIVGKSTTNVTVIIDLKQAIRI